MKLTSKERLNDKARKMIDLLYDEVYDGGEKNISASFVDRHHLKHTLNVGISVVDENKPQEDIPEPNNESAAPTGSDSTETPTFSPDLDSTENTDLVDNNDSQGS